MVHSLFIKCKHCGKEFNLIKDKRRRYCSNECREADREEYRRNYNPYYYYKRKLFPKK
jgi:endogenous inhibitor of DNA gyrase (YacG/DUF329 family)